MRLVAKHILATIVVLSAPIAALALPVIEWDTVRVSYDYGPWGEVRFSLRTEHSFSPADCWGGGEREADGWWTTLHQESGSIAAAFRFFVVHYGDLVDFDLSESSEIIFGNEGWEHPALRLDWDNPCILVSVLGIQNMRAKHCARNMAGQNCYSTAKPYMFSGARRSARGWGYMRERARQSRNQRRRGCS